jgi:hypothetical protein
VGDIKDIAVFSVSIVTTVEQTGYASGASVVRRKRYAVTLVVDKKKFA